MANSSSWSSRVVGVMIRSQAEEIRWEEKLVLEKQGRGKKHMGKLEII